MNIKTMIIFIIISAVLLVVTVGLIIYLRKIMKQLKYTTISLEEANSSLALCINSLTNDLSTSVNSSIVELKNLLDLAKERYNINSESIQSKLESAGFKKETK